MSTASETSCPDVVLGSIAWYPDQLDEERRGLVEAHAAGCAACREELELVQGEGERGAPIPDAVAERVYAGVLARIEASESGEGREARLPRQEQRARAPRRPTGAFGARPAALAAGIALALLGGAIGAVGALWLGGGPASVYRTVGETPGVVPGVTPADAPALDVVFRSDARAEAIHAALRAIGGQIVSGPTQLGVYRVRLGSDADESAAAKLLRGEGRGVAIFAEPAPR